MSGPSDLRVRCAPAALCIGVWLVSFGAGAHTTAIPHHVEDLEDLAAGRDKRGVVLLATAALIATMGVVSVLVLRQSRAEHIPESARQTQERLKGALLEVASRVRPALGKDFRDVLREAVPAFEEAIGAPARPCGSSPHAHRFRCGGDELTVTYHDDASATRIELVAVSGFAGARVALARDGRCSVGSFIVRGDGLTEAGG
jgi:hypothetical protein